MGYVQSSGVVPISETDRRLKDIVKRLDDCHYGVIVNLEKWIRDRQWAFENKRPVPKSADDAMDRAIKAYRAEKELFAELLSINNNALQIEGPR